MIVLEDLFRQYYPDYCTKKDVLEPFYSFFCMGFEACEDMIEKKDCELEPIKHFKEQIEKMKCCENCKQYDNPKKIQVGFGDYKDICDFCKKNDKWELAE